MCGHWGHWGRPGGLQRGNIGILLRDPMSGGAFTWSARQAPLPVQLLAAVLWPPPHPHFPQPPAAPDASAQAKIEELQADNAKLEGDLRDLQAKLAQVPPPTDAGVHCVSRCADCTVLCHAFA